MWKYCSTKWCFFGKSLDTFSRECCIENGNLAEIFREYVPTNTCSVVLEFAAPYADIAVRGDIAPPTWTMPVTFPTRNQLISLIMIRRDRTPSITVPNWLHTKVQSMISAVVFTRVKAVPEFCCPSNVVSWRINSLTFFTKLPPQPTKSYCECEVVQYFKRKKCQGYACYSCTRVCQRVQIQVDQVWKWEILVKNMPSRNRDYCHVIVIIADIPGKLWKILTVLFRAALTWWWCEKTNYIFTAFMNESQNDRCHCDQYHHSEMAHCLAKYYMHKFRWLLWVLWWIFCISAEKEWKLYS